MSAEEFLNACKTGDLPTVIKLHNAGINLDCRNSNEFTGLHLAASNNRPEVVKYLCSETAVNVDAVQITGMHAIHLAAFNGCTSIVQYLIEEAGVDKNLPKGGTSATPAFLCSQKGHDETLRYLVSIGVDVNFPTTKGDSPLAIAAECAKLGCAKILVNEGKCDIDFPNTDGYTPLMKCCAIFGAKPPITEKAAVAKFLIEAGADVNATQNTSRRPVHLASRYGYIETLRSLIKHGVDVNARDLGDFVPLCDAASNQKIQSIEVLLSNGADPAAHGWNGNTFFHLAANFDNERLIDCILSKTKRSALAVDIQNYYGYTPLHLAVKKGNEKTVERLLKANASVHQSTHLGDTALHIAIESGQRALVDRLIQAGADPSLKNKLGQSCYTLANATNMKDVFKDSTLSAADEMNTIADFFVKEAKQSINNDVDLEHVLLLKKQDLLAADCMPHYDECKRQGWHVTATTVKYGEKVLFVSHRWGAIDAPDPTGEQFNLVKRYLQTVVKDIDYIWVDYGCICQDKSSELFRAHLVNIPTAVMCSTHMLIIPQLSPVPLTSNPNENIPATNLTDYLSRAWCLFESISGLLTSTTIHLAFQLGNEEINFRIFGQPQAASSSLGFYQAYVSEYNKWINNSPWAWTACNRTTLLTFLTFVEPCRILAVLMKIGRGQEDFGFIAERVKTLQVTREDIDGHDLLQELWTLLGHCFNEADKEVVLNLTLFMGFFMLKSGGTTEGSVEKQDDPVVVDSPQHSLPANTVVDLPRHSEPENKTEPNPRSTQITATTGSCCTIM